MKVVSLDKKLNAKKRASEIATRIKDDSEYKNLPLDAKFASDEFEKEVAKVLYEVSKYNDGD